ncbi:hypothetical protein AMTR_s00002p00070650 [Amborella trichopoda]|uniref:Uncharacterized protein n=1 Tax=Amborella trichopoda TaxID=13333 RepID=W1NZ76_AMBTC|nr:hypothetical protein AMTR_s00002p00070650 [Amborella trichopoda]
MPVKDAPGWFYNQEVVFHSDKQLSGICFTQRGTSFVILVELGKKLIEEKISNFTLAFIFAVLHIYRLTRPISHPYKSMGCVLQNHGPDIDTLLQLYIKIHYLLLFTSIVQTNVEKWPPRHSGPRSIAQGQLGGLEGHATRRALRHPGKSGDRQGLGQASPGMARPDPPLVPLGLTHAQLDPNRARSRAKPGRASPDPAQSSSPILWPRPYLPSRLPAPCPGAPIYAAHDKLWRKGQKCPSSRGIFSLFTLFSLY